MDASLSSTHSVEMSRIAVSPRMVTAWVAGIRVITLLAMPSSLSHFPREAKSRINGGMSVPHDGGGQCSACSMLMHRGNIAVDRAVLFDVDAVAGAFMRHV